MKRVAIIGCGVSGLTAIKALKEINEEETDNPRFEIVCYEKTNRLGGLWSFRTEPTPGVSSVMRSTLMNTSKEVNAFSDFPPHPSAPLFMHNTFAAEYLESYAKKFDLHQYIHYGREVVDVEDNGVEQVTTKRWTITVKSTTDGNHSDISCDAIIVCNGKQTYPNEPHFEGLDTFGGQVVHSQVYKDASPYKGKRVLVIGSSNSGCDIACELCSAADKVFLSSRRGFWLVTRTGPRGLPSDISLLTRFVSVVFNLLPLSITTAVFEWYQNRQLDHRLFPFSPNFSFFSLIPTVNDELVPRLYSGVLTMKGAIDRFTKTGVAFKGDSKLHEIEAVILATGYRIEFPFLRKFYALFNSHKTADDLEKSNKFCLFLYENMFSPYVERPETLSFIGLLQSLGPNFPAFELQTRFTAALLAGSALPLPSVNEMVETITKEQTERLKRYSYHESNGSFLSVDYLTYLDAMAARLGCKPSLLRMLATDPKLFLCSFFGPLVAYQYRLEGPHAWSGARNAILTVNQRVMDGLK